MARTRGVAEVVDRRYWREAEARIVVEAWRDSGASLSGFARRHGVDPRRVARWASRLERAAAPVRFHPVRLAWRAEPGAGGGAAIEIQLVGGQRVRVGRGFQTEDLRRVLALLDARPPC